MKEKAKKIFEIVITILIIVFAILWYPWFVSVEDGKTTCRNIFGKTMICR